MKRPFIFVNAAMTLDGKIDTVARQGAPISSPADWQRVDALRAASDAVMVGGNTLLREDPRLLVKTRALRAARVHRGLPPNPVKVGVLSDAGQLDPQGRFAASGPARVLLYTSQRTSPAAIRRLQTAGIEVYPLGRERVALTDMAAHLASLGLHRVMVEGGGTLIAALLQAGLVDEIHLYIAPLIFGGASAPTLADGPGFQRSNAIALQRDAVEALPDGGLLVHYTVTHQEKTP